MLPIQLLENRRFLSVDPYFEVTSRGTLVVHGTDAAEQITVQLVRDDASRGFRVIVQADGSFNVERHEFSGKFSHIKRIRVEAGGGDDRLNVGGGSQMTRPVTLLGEAGNDQIDFSSNGPVMADGGDGLDQISDVPYINVAARRNSEVLDAFFADAVENSVNTLLGGNGDDTLSGDANDVIDGGTGTDQGVIAFSSRNGAISNDRSLGLATDYYARLGATGLDEFRALDITDAFQSELIGGGLRAS